MGQFRSIYRVNRSRYREKISSRRLWHSKFLLCVLCSLAFPCALSAAPLTPWNFRRLPVPEGPPQPNVRDILEDGHGQVWISTWGSGLLSVDGTEWKMYKTTDGLPSNWVRRLSLAQDGTLWISTTKGLACIREGILHAFTPENTPGLPNGNVQQIHASLGNSLILGLYDGTILQVSDIDAPLEAFRNDPTRWTVIQSGDADATNRISRIVETPSGTLWFTFRHGGWASLDENGLQAFSNDRAVKLITWIDQPGEDHGLWAALNNGRTIYHLQNGAWKPVADVPASVHTLYSNVDGTIYVGTESGLFQRQGEEVQRIDLGAGVGSPDITCLHVSTDGVAWVGTREGLIRGALPSWRVAVTGEKDHGTLALLESPRQAGALISIRSNLDVAHLQGDSWVTQGQIEATDPFDSFWSFPGDTVLWGLSSKQLLAIDPDSGTTVSVVDLPEKNERADLFRTQAGAIWFFAEDGIHELNGDQWVRVPKDPAYDRRWAYTAYEVEPGVFYIGLNGEIERWDHGVVTRYGEAEGLVPDDEIHTIGAMSNGELWFGSHGSGIYVLSDGHFRQIGSKDGLDHHSISLIKECSDGTVWVAYRRVGLASFRDNRWLNFAYDTGLPNAAIRNLVEGQDHRLWVNANNEFTYLYTPDRVPPETTVVAPNRRVPNHGIGTFFFSAHDAWEETPTHELLYSWRLLNGKDGTPLTSWSNYDSKTTLVTTPLSSGAYTLEVAAVDRDRNEDPTPATVDFRVDRPLWQYPPLVLGTLFLLSVVIAALVQRARTYQALRFNEAALSESNKQLMSEIRERIQAEKRLNLHFEQLEGLVEERTQALEEAQRALVRQERLATMGQITAVVSHELRNPLGTLKGTLYLIARKVREAGLDLERALERSERSIVRCDRIIEELLDFTRNRALRLEPVQSPLWIKQIIEDLDVPNAIKVDFDLQCDRVVHFDPEEFRRAVINVVNNAVQSLLENAIDGRRITLRNCFLEDRYELHVIDNGPGIAQEDLVKIFEPLYSTRGFGIGLGVPIAHDIMTKHNGGLKFFSTIGEGTTVVLWLPLQGVTGQPKPSA